MYIKPRPVGTTPPFDEDRMPLWRAINGDDLWMTTKATLMDGVTPATPTNSKLVFALSETRFNYTPIWTADWHAGIEEVDPENHPGLVKIKIPDEVGDTLRRGVYSFSMTVSNRFGKDTTTVLVGNLLIEYEPTSPEHDIPYKNQTGEQDGS
jgi:hypothetical protein